MEEERRKGVTMEGRESRRRMTVGREGAAVEEEWRRKWSGSGRDAVLGDRGEKEQVGREKQ